MLGGGGYVAGPVGLAATLERIPIVLSEADSHLGLTNRALASRARRVCLAFPLEGRDGDRYRVTGRPVPPTYADRDGARAELGIGPEETCVLVFGGSLGARSINLAAVEGLAGAPYRVLHVAGRRDFAELTAPDDRYVLRDYLSPFGVALAAADLAVARSGGSVFELAQYGLPAVLIPYPHASADHQSTNARWMADAGAAVVARRRGAHPGAPARRGRRDRARRRPAARDERRLRAAGPARRRPRHRGRGARGGTRKLGRGAARAAPLDLVRGSTDRSDEQRADRLR